MAKLKGQLFARLALDYFDHPKIMSLSAEAIVAHLEMIVYCRKYETDGLVPVRKVKQVPKQVLDELLSNDLDAPSLTLNDDGSANIYGYEDMQETSGQIEERRQVRAEAGRRGGLARVAKSKQMLKQTPSKGLSKNQAETETETENITSDSSAEETRPDMNEILDHLDNRLEGNALKKPNRVKSNLRAARLLLDRDGHSVDDVKQIIDYAQDTEFWIPNIRSMSKLREKWDQLSAQSGRTRSGPKPFDLWNSGGPI